MALESSPENQTPEVDLMLARFEARTKRGVIERVEMERTFALTDKAFKRAKEILAAKNFFQTATTDDYKMLSNSWTAWAANGIFKDGADDDLRKSLQSILEPSGDAKVNLARRYARQVWRTQLSVYIIQEVGKLTLLEDAQKSTIIEQIFAAQIVSEAEAAPMAALTGAMHLDPKLGIRAYRTGLAKEMDASTVQSAMPVPLVQRLAGDSAQIASIRVVVGGELLKIATEYTEAFLLKKAVYKRDENRLYAQMENGCRGNLVIIDLVPET